MERLKGMQVKECIAAEHEYERGDTLASFLALLCHLLANIVTFHQRM